MTTYLNDEAVDLPRAQIAHYQNVLKVHGNTTPQGCNICQRFRCQDFLNAFDVLAVAGELMGLPENVEWDRASLYGHRK